MLEAKYIREHLDEVRERIGLRGGTVDFGKFVSIDGERRKAIQQWESLRALQKKVSDEVSQKKRKGENASDLIAEMKKVSQELKALDGVVEEKERVLQEFLLTVPNIPIHPSQPERIPQTMSRSGGGERFRPLTLSPNPTGTWGRN